MRASTVVAEGVRPNSPIPCDQLSTSAGVTGRGLAEGPEERPEHPSVPFDRAPVVAAGRSRGLVIGCLLREWSPTSLTQVAGEGNTMIRSWQVGAHQGARTPRRQRQGAGSAGVYGMRMKQ